MQTDKQEMDHVIRWYRFCYENQQNAHVKAIYKVWAEELTSRGLGRRNR